MTPYRFSQGSLEFDSSRSLHPSSQVPPKKGTRRATGSSGKKVASYSFLRLHGPQVSRAEGDMGVEAESPRSTGVAAYQPPAKVVACPPMSHARARCSRLS
jgi:hypothetical protein